MASELISTSTDVVRFSNGPHGWLHTTLAVQNRTTETIMYRLKTTSPNDYYGTPTLAAIHRGQTVQLKLCRRPLSSLTNGHECKDKFLILAAPMSAAAQEVNCTEQEQLSSSALTAVWKSIPPRACVKRKLRVVIVGQRLVRRDGNVDGNVSVIGNENGNGNGNGNGNRNGNGNVNMNGNGNGDFHREGNGNDNDNNIETTVLGSPDGHVVSDSNNNGENVGDDEFWFAGRQQVDTNRESSSFRTPERPRTMTPTIAMTLPTANITSTAMNATITDTSNCTMRATVRALTTATAATTPGSTESDRETRTMRARLRAMRSDNNTSSVTQQHDNSQAESVETPLRAVRMGTEIGPATSRLNSPLIRVIGRVRAIVPSLPRNTSQQQRHSSTPLFSPSFNSSPRQQQHQQQHQHQHQHQHHHRQQQQREDITVMASRFVSNMTRHSSERRRSAQRDRTRRASCDRPRASCIPVKPLPTFLPTPAHEGIQCPICLDPLANDTLAAPPCSHTMHASCLRTWNTRYGCINCPVCRYTEPLSMHAF